MDNFQSRKWIVAAPVLGVALLGMLSVGAVAQQRVQTAVKTIGPINKAENGTLYFRVKGGGGWGAAGCPSAIYVQVRDQAKGILAIGLTAKVTGAKVSFLGTCAGGDYFNGDYIIMQ